MRKLRQTLQLLAKNGRRSVTLAAEAASSASASSSSSSSSSARLIRPSAEPHPNPLPRFVIDSFRSWRSSNQFPPGPSFAAFVSPIISKQAMSSTAHLRIGLQGLLDRGVCSLKVSLQRKRFDAQRLFSSPRGFWSFLTSTPDGVVYSLIGANVAVYFLWRIADPTFMKKNFMLSINNVKSWRLHTLVTSAFSHADLDHLVANMIGLFFFGTSIARLFGAEFLLNLYLAGALGGSIFFLAHKALVARSLEGMQRLDHSRVCAMGASAAVNAIILLDVFLFPKNIYYVNLIIPVPAILMGAILIGSDLWRIKKGDTHVSGSAHLGGAVVAAIVCARIKGWI